MPEVVAETQRLAAQPGSVTPSAGDYALKSDLPQPASTMPPGIDVGGAVGTAPRYALEDHKHATSVQRGRATVSGSGGIVTVTFAKPYDAGVVPICSATAEIGAGTTQAYEACVIGAPTNTQVKFLVQAVAKQQTLSILGMLVNPFSAAPSGTAIHWQAAKPTQ